MTRRRALWREGVGRPSQASSGRPIRATGGPGARLTRGRHGNCEIAPDVPEFQGSVGRAADDLGLFRVGAAGHPMLHHRQRLQALGASTVGALDQVQPGKSVALAGRVLIRQRPPTAKGMAFLTLEERVAFGSRHTLSF